ncbi:MAG: hypothetical protein JNM18_14190, partial [Planctomycetaceae bacterium]|nr:hypothetical protein [Planctomycetaceae bacterium]
VIVAFGGLVGAAGVGQWLVQYRTRTDIQIAEIEYQAAKTAQQKLELAQKQLRDTSQEAELLTFLRHPWPRTQILRRVTSSLPNEVMIERLRIGRDENKPKEVLTVGVIKPTDSNGTKTTATSTPVEKDLKQLRDECDTRRVIVELTGYTSDLTALHVYLNQLASESLFAQAELTSIQSVEKGTERRSQFTARLVLAPGHGQRKTTEPPKSPTPSATPAAVTTTIVPLVERS